MCVRKVLLHLCGKILWEIVFYRTVEVQFHSFLTSVLDGGE